MRRIINRSVTGKSMRAGLAVLFTMISLTWSQSKNATMTLYKDGIALIKQPVAWRAPAGKSVIKYNRLPEGLYDDSPFLNLNDITILSQKLENDIFSGESYFRAKLGEQVEVKVQDDGPKEGILLDYNSSSITIRRKTKFTTYSRSLVEYISTTDKSENPQLKPLLSWEISTPIEGKVRGDLIYISRGFDWNAIYRMVLDEKSKTAQLIPEAQLINNSNIDFTKLMLQLVEGNLHKTGQRPMLPRTRMMMSRAGAMEALSDPAVPTQEILGDYHIYTLPERLAFNSKENITVRLYEAREINYEKTYVFENSERNQREEPLQVELKFDNTKGNNLNIPLPAGKISMYLTTKKGGLEFIGEDNLKQIPKGESATVIAGRAFDVIGKRRVLNYDRQRKSEEAAIELSLTNTKDETVNVRVVEHINGDWVIRDASHNYIKKDASTIHIPLSVPANKSVYVSYTYRKEWK